jgi:hypothetical protein
MANFLLQSEKVQTADSNQCWQEIRDLVIWAFCSNPSTTKVFVHLYQPGHFFQRYRLNLSNMILSIQTYTSKKNKSIIIIIFHYGILFVVFWDSAIPYIKFLPCASKLRFVPDDFRTKDSPAYIYLFHSVIDFVPTEQHAPNNYGWRWSHNFLQIMLKYYRVGFGFIMKYKIAKLTMCKA